MATARTHLKVAREAISSKNWQQALSSAQAALDIDHQSYNAFVFLALAQLNLDKVKESEESYRSAITLDPIQPLAWQGLISLYEKQVNIDRLIDSIHHLINIWFQKGETEKLGEMILKLISLPGKSRKQSIEALSLVLRDSPHHSLLSTLPEPDYTNPKASPILKLQEILSNTLPILNEIIELTQAELEQTLSNEISKRRTRLTSVPKTAAQTRAEVINETYPSSLLPKFWQEILDHPMADDQLRRQTEATMMTFYLDWLGSLPSPSVHQVSDNKKSVSTGVNVGSLIPEGLTRQATKDSLRQKIEDLARGQAILKSPNQKAWDVVLDWGQVLPDDECSDSYGFLKSLPDAMPNAPLSNLVLAFQQLHSQTEEEEELAFADPLEQIELSFEIAQNHSILSHVLAASVYYDLKQWGTVIQIAEEGINKINKLEKVIGKPLSQVKRKLTINLACALTFESPPTHHLRSIPYLDAILAEEPNNSPVLLARASVLWHKKQWELAEKFYSRSLEASPDLPIEDRLEVQSEKAWCIYKMGKISLAIKIFERIIQSLEELLLENPQSQELNYHLARSWYQLGRCNWALSHPSEEGNNDDEGINLNSLDEVKKNAYTCFIKSVKCDTSIASSFTYLGLYYAEQNDHARSSKCFQRAFELDPTQDIAAFRLASEFADNMQWELVSVVTKRLLFGPTPQTLELDHQEDDDDTGPPVLRSLASYQQHAWAWKAAGVVELNQNKFNAAINTFQRAARCSPDDYQIWFKLGLAYQGAGKHVAALKSFITARRLIDTPPEGVSLPTEAEESVVWYLDFCIGNTQRQIGLLEPAIKILTKIVEHRPQEFGVKIILAETRFATGLNHSEKGAFEEAERHLIGCLDITRDLFDNANSKFATKSGSKIAGNVFAEFARWNYKIPLTTFNVNSGGDFNEKLRTHVSYFVNLVARMNVDDTIPSVRSVRCLEAGAILSENGSPGIFYLVSALAFKARLSLEISDARSDLAAQEWADLAISLGKLSRWLESSARESSSSDPSDFFKTQTEPQGILSEAIYCMKTSLQLNSFSSGNWNILGVLTFGLNPRLSQHAFIRSVELSEKNYMAWCNLGFFYLAHSDLELAAQAFGKSKTIEPDWSLTCMGLALIASLNGQQIKAGELVEHAYNLSLGSISIIESCCATVALEMFTSQAQNSSQHINTLVRPLLAAEKLLKRYPRDPTVLNLHALISECLGNLNQATTSLERSAEILEAIYEVTESVEVEQRYMLANLNLGRIRLRRKKYQDAISALEIIPALRAKCDKNSAPLEHALKTTIVRSQATSQISISQFFLNDLQSCLSGLEEILDEIKSIQQHESMRDISKTLTKYSSSISGLIAKVLWSSSTNKTKAKELMVETILESSQHKVYDFDLINSYLAISILDVPDDELEVVLKVIEGLESTDELAENQTARKDEDDLNNHSQEHENSITKKEYESLSRMKDLVTGNNLKLMSRNHKNETNTILNFLSSSIELLSRSQSSKRMKTKNDTLEKIFEEIKRVICKFVNEIRETELEKKIFQQEMLILKSQQSASLPSNSVDDSVDFISNNNNITGSTMINEDDLPTSSFINPLQNLCLPDQF